MGSRKGKGDKKSKAWKKDSMGGLGDLDHLGRLGADAMATKQPLW